MGTAEGSVGEWFDPDCTESGCNGHHRWIQWVDGKPIVQHTLLVTDEEYEFIKEMLEQ